VESAVGAHILNSTTGTNIEVFYWREGNHEVDFVLRAGRIITAIEVKSGRHRDSLPGMEAFAKAFKPKHQLLVGGQGISLEEFFLTPVGRFVE
jgi:predicted AAA+ superfamily ATPase